MLSVPGNIQVVHATAACLHMALCGHSSGVESIRDLFKCSKDSASAAVHNENKLFGLGF